MVSVPARVTRRGGVRSPAILNPAGCERAAPVLQAVQDVIGAADGSDAPVEGQHVAPVTVGHKELRKQNRIGLRQRPLELREPRFDGFCRDGFFDVCITRHAFNLQGVRTIKNLSPHAGRGRAISAFTRVFDALWRG